MANGTPDAQYAALAQRVTGIEASLAGLSAQINSLANTITEKSKTPWGIIFSGATFLLAVLIAVGGVVSWGLLSQNAAIVKTLDDFRATYENNRIVSRQDNDARFAAVGTQLATSVPRGEHERVWSANEQRFGDLQRQIDENKQTMASLYGARDFFKDLSERQTKIETMITEFLTQRRATQ